MRSASVQTAVIPAGSCASIIPCAAPNTWSVHLVVYLNTYGAVSPSTSHNSFMAAEEPVIELWCLNQKYLDKSLSTKVYPIVNHRIESNEYGLDEAQLLSKQLWFQQNSVQALSYALRQYMISSTSVLYVHHTHSSTSCLPVQNNSFMTAQWSVTVNELSRFNQKYLDKQPSGFANGSTNCLSQLVRPKCWGAPNKHAVRRAFLRWGCILLTNCICQTIQV